MSRGKMQIHHFPICSGVCNCFFNVALRDPQPRPYEATTRFQRMLRPWPWPRRRSEPWPCEATTRLQRAVRPGEDGWARPVPGASATQLPGAGAARPRPGSRNRLWARSASASTPTGAGGFSALVARPRGGRPRARPPRRQRELARSARAHSGLDSGRRRGSLIRPRRGQKPLVTARRERVTDARLDPRSGRANGLGQKGLPKRGCSLAAGVSGHDSAGVTRPQALAQTAAAPARTARRGWLERPPVRAPRRPPVVGHGATGPAPVRAGHDRHMALCPRLGARRGPPRRRVRPRTRRAGSSSIRPTRHHTPSRAPSRLTFGLWRQLAWSLCVDVACRRTW
jgi:hypothetical protein